MDAISTTVDASLRRYNDQSGPMDALMPHSASNAKPAALKQVSFEVPGIPIAQPRQRHRLAGIPGKSFIQNYTPKGDPVNAFKAAVRLVASQHFTVPLEGPVILEATFIMPRPQAMMWKKRATPRAPHDHKPDADNLGKALMDALKGVAWRDDSQVWSLKLMKVIANGQEVPRTLVTISETLSVDGVFEELERAKGVQRL